MPPWKSILLCFCLTATVAVAAETVPAEEVNMTWWQAFVLGAVEGVTEYLPVSSTGHLILVQRAMGIGQTEETNEAADAYSIAIQGGAILAVLTLYFPYMRRMFMGLLGKDSYGLKLSINILIAFLPAAVIGLLFHAQIKEYLFNLWAIVFSWFVGGVAILAVTWWGRGRPSQPGLEIEDLTWKHALFIGFMQCIAMWPGTSRSLVTILGGLLIGMNLTSAVVFSFLLGVITLTAATAYDTLTHGTTIVEAFGFANFAIGFIVATFAAIFSVKWLLGYLKKHGLALFGYYRIALAVIVAILMLAGVLHDQL